MIVQRNSKRTSLLNSDDVIIVKEHRFKVPFIFNKKNFDTIFYTSSNKLVLHRIFIDAIYK